MEQREQAVDSPADSDEGRLRGLALKWFLGTQVHLIVHNGFFPTWFLGFVTRKDAEEILREKELGCFLIRLSDKAIGYILSYKGRDRCRHFMINQSELGQFIVCGDTEAHDTIPNLIEYYKTSPIEPFGEYLTSSCFEALNDDLYDTIQISPKEKPVATVRAGKHVTKKQSNTPASEQPPTRPPKSSRTLDEVPPLPRRSRHLDNGLLNDHDGVLYAQLRKQHPREPTRDHHICQDIFPSGLPGRSERFIIQDQNTSRSISPSPDSIYSELDLLDSRSKSLPLLAGSSDGDQSYRLSIPPQTPPRLSPRPIKQSNSHGTVSPKTSPRSRPTSSHSLDYVSDSSIYHLAGRPGSPHISLTEKSSSDQDCDSVYAEVPIEAIIRTPNDNTYEHIPGCGDKARHKPNSNRYEPLEDVRPKQNHSSWGLKVNMVKYEVASSSDVNLTVFVQEWIEKPTGSAEKLRPSLEMTDGSGFFLTPNVNDEEDDPGSY